MPFPYTFPLNFLTDNKVGDSMCADSFVFGRHDLAIEDTDGDMMGLMCAKDKGVPLYEEHDSKYLSDQYYTNTPNRSTSFFP